MTIRASRILILLSLLCPVTAAWAQDESGPVIVFFGDSLTAGYGVEPDQAYPALIQSRLEAEGRPGLVINAGLSGETTAAGLRRVDWILRRPVDIFVLALGGNDGLRGIPVEETQRNLERIFQKVRDHSPGTRLILAGMQAPPNMGRTFTDAFRRIFPEVALEEGATLIPFLLEGVGGEKELNLPDGIHPNPEGQERVAENVWAILSPILEDFD